MLKLPLRYYDDSGRILPPKWLYILCLLLCGDWIAFIFSLASRSQANELLSLFYPNKSSLGVALVASLPILVGLLLVGQRERLWKKRYTTWCTMIKPTILLGCVFLFFVQLAHFIDHQWSFDLVVALRGFICIVAFYVIWKSRHLRWMIEDWAIVDTSSTHQ